MTGTIMPVVSTDGTSLGLWILQYPGRDAWVFESRADAEEYRTVYDEALRRVSPEEP